MPMNILENVEDIYLSNSTNPTGKLSAALRPYAMLHPLIIKLQDTQIINYRNTLNPKVQTLWTLGFKRAILHLIRYFEPWSSNTLNPKVQTLWTLKFKHFEPWSSNTLKPNIQLGNQDSIGRCWEVLHEHVLCLLRQVGHGSNHSAPWQLHFHQDGQSNYWRQEDSKNININQSSLKHSNTLKAVINNFSRKNAIMEAASSSRRAWFWKVCYYLRNNKNWKSKKLLNCS